jgi:hypothetical protein
MRELAPLLGLLAGAVSVADTVPYVRDILRGATRPHRGTWLIWGVLAVVASSSQYADGASWSLVMPIVQAALTCTVFALAISRGTGAVSLGEALLIALAGAGVVSWAIAEEPVVATACVIAADSIGVGLMVPKTYNAPESETLATFALASLAGALAAVAVAAPDPALLLYPIYFCIANGALAALIVHRRRSLLTPAQRR